MTNVKSTQNLVATGLSLLFLFVAAYEVKRHETALLLSTYSILFIVYLWILLTSTSEHLTFWIWSAIGLRFFVLFSTPNLSDDFYRFIWDGRLLASGHHPFSHVPSFYIENKLAIPGLDEELYSKLNSKNYFTIYPPVAQYLFWISTKLFSTVYGSLVFFKSCIFFAEVGSILVIRRIANQLNLSHHHVLIYALNPLVILELVGNAHFEAIMIVFLLLSLLFLIDGKQSWAAVFMGVAISVKLIPLIFLPAILPLLGWKKAFAFYVMTAVTILLLASPLFNMDIIIGFTNSLGYYFSRFEFNASIYYLVRWLGYVLVGYNIIHIAGGILAALAAFMIMKISFQWQHLNTATHNDDAKTSKNQLQNFFRVLMWSQLIYLLFATTIHPWYITTLLALAALTQYRFAVVWTLTIFFTYAGYGLGGFGENLWIVAFEYMVVLGYLGYELLWKKNASLSVA
jgi:alpha-1,6-mannosyltransferase